MKAVLLLSDVNICSDSIHSYPTSWYQVLCGLSDARISTKLRTNCNTTQFSEIKYFQENFLNGFLDLQVLVPYTYATFKKKISSLCLQMA